MTADERVNDAIERGADRAMDRRGHVTIWVLLVVVLIGLSAFGVAFFSVQGDNQELRESVAALANQVTHLGGTPVVPAPGERGPVGPAGRDGRDGDDGTTPACLSEPPQCRGANGADATGAPGADGQPGKDGTDGKDGRDGVDGKPPAGWTWTDSNGREQRCTRDPASPDTDPTYACTAPSTGPPGTTTAPLLPIGR